MQRSTIYSCIAIVVVLAVLLRFERSLSGLNATVAALGSERAHVSQAVPYQRVIERHVVVTPPVGAQPAVTGGTPSAQKVAGESAPSAHEQLGTTLQGRFAGERQDPAWAPTMERGLDSHIRALPRVNGGVSDVHCRASICEILGVFDSISDYNKIMFGLFAPQDPNGPDGLPYSGTYAMPLERTPDGKLGARVFVGRQGRPLGGGLGSAGEQ